MRSRRSLWQGFKQLKVKDPEEYLIKAQHYQAALVVLDGFEQGIKEVLADGDAALLSLREILEQREEAEKQEEEWRDWEDRHEG
jgi:hypothetical protein